MESPVLLRSSRIGAEHAFVFVEKSVRIRVELWFNRRRL